MLTHISIQNFAIAEHLELEFAPGMTVITGETGAGKSITLDALGLTLGDRADSGLVRHGAQRADLHASFDISQLPHAREWLTQRDLDNDDSCILRRVISKEGRSRAYINGSPVPLADVKTLGEMLIDIHSQHEHQSLLKKETHRRLLDAFAQATELAATTKQQQRQWQQLAEHIQQLQNRNSENAARVELLTYQVEELSALELTRELLAELEAEHKQLANAEENLLASQKVLELCAGGDQGNLLDLLRLASHDLEPIADQHPSLGEALELLSSAQIQVDEARHALQRHVDSFEADPERLQELDQRLTEIYTIARKHKVHAEQLPDTLEQLQQELEGLDCSDEKLQQLQTELKTLEQAYRDSANKLSLARQKAAKQLTAEVEKQLKLLGMQHCAFVIDLSPRASSEPHPQGNEQVEFLIAPNPGQPAQPLIKIASGGELSRISLAIQVVTAATSTIPTLAFDEVDVGIGGGTAEVVGNLLRQLGNRGQVLCVTHQPQVASKGHQHLFVSKANKAGQTSTQVTVLSGDHKVQEIARMLGGIEITNTTLEHAREMLAVAD